MLCLVTQSYPTLCDPMDCNVPGASVHGDSPGKNTGVGCHALLQGIFPTQGLKPRAPALQAESLPSEPPGKPKNTEVGAYPFSRRSSQPRNWTAGSCTMGRFFTSQATGEAASTPYNQTNKFLSRGYSWKVTRCKFSLRKALRRSPKSIDELKQVMLEQFEVYGTLELLQTLNMGKNSAKLSQNFTLKA